MAKGLSEDELRAITDAEMRLAVGFWSGKLANMRAKAMSYYLGEPKFDLEPPEVEGRSSVVSPDVRNTIESMLPQLMVKFVGGDEVVRFEPQKPEDEQKAEQATDYINHIFYVKNPGERIAYNWMKDALLSKNGIVKVWWDTRKTETREEYAGLTEIELAQLMDDPEIEITEQKSYEDTKAAEQKQEQLEQIQQRLDMALNDAQVNPQAAQAIPVLQQQMEQLVQMPVPTLFDVVAKRVKEGGKVCVENVPPEEFLIARKAKSIEDATFVGHRVARTVSDLKSMGYKNVDNITSDDQATSLNQERIQRLAWDDEMAYLQTDTVQNMDESQRLIWVTECYVRCDYDGDGIAELRKVVRAGNQILENEIVDCAPFVSICPVPMPHKFFGLSVADLATEAQRTKTSMLRAVLDNLYMESNGRYFAVDGQVNLDDLMTSRPGGIVRIKTPGSVGRLDQAAGNAGQVLSMMEFMQGFLEDSTGFTRYNQGSDGDSLNQTATGVTQITNRADMRLDLIARNFAQGFRDLFRMMLKLCAQYNCKEEVVKLRGEWVTVNPRDWRNGFETVVEVGLGTGSKDQQVRHLLMLSQRQAMGLQIGTANPINIYETDKELAKALGYKNADRFFQDPRKAPPQPNPMQMQAQQQMQIEQAKIQAQGQVEQMKLQAQAQLDQVKRQHEIELEKARLEYQAMVDTNRQRAEAEQKSLEAQQQAQLDALKQQIDQERQMREQEFLTWKAKLDAETKVLVAQIQAASRAKPESEEGPEPGEAAEEAAEQNTENLQQNALAMAMQGFTEALNNLRQPRTIVRGPDGKAQGII